VGDDPWREGVREHLERLADRNVLGPTTNERLLHPATPPGSR
jgi:hypothetical protein